MENESDFYHEIEIYYLLFSTDLSFPVEIRKQYSLKAYDVSLIREALETTEMEPED